jgi:thioredoxin
MSTVSNLSDDRFEAEVLQAKQPVLVDYWAEWCGPCKAVGPVVEATAAKYADTLKVAKVDVDSNNATAFKYGIRAIPTLMLFKNGEVVATHTGAVSQGQLDAWLEPHLKPSA